MRLIPGATVQVHPSPLKPLNVAYNGRQRYIHATSISNVYCAITWRTCGYFKPSTGGSNRCHCRHNEYGKQESKKARKKKNREIRLRVYYFAFYRFSDASLSSSYTFCVSRFRLLLHRTDSLYIVCTVHIQNSDIFVAHRCAYPKPTAALAATSYIFVY